MTASHVPVAVGIALALGLSVFGCSDPAPGGTADSSGTRIITPSAVAKTPLLREGADYEVTARLPGTVGTKATHWRGLVSKTEAFGELQAQTTIYLDRVPTTIILMDTRTRRVKKIAEQPAGTQVVGMDFSRSHIVWTETTSSDASSEPWVLRSYDRGTGSVRTLATSDSLGVQDPPWLPPQGVMPRLNRGQVYLLAADSNNLPPKATAYRVSLEGNGGLKKVAADVQGVFPSRDHLTLIRNGEFYRRELGGGKEKPLDRKRRGSEACPGWAVGDVVVECDSYNHKPRLTILTNGRTTEIRFPKPDPNSMNYGVGYLNANAGWVTFSFDDKAYVYNLTSGRMGILKGAQYTTSNPSWGRAIKYLVTGGVVPRPTPMDLIQLN